MKDQLIKVNAVPGYHGEISTSIDHKMRTTVPARFRKVMAKRNRLLLYNPAINISEKGIYHLDDLILQFPEIINNPDNRSEVIENLDLTDINKIVFLRDLYERAGDDKGAPNPVLQGYMDSFFNKEQFYYSYTYQIELDSRGRFMLPFYIKIRLNLEDRLEYRLERLNPDERITYVGMGNHILLKKST